MSILVSIILIMMFTKPGAAARPVVTFTPNWGKIFVGESIRMTCEVEGNHICYWYNLNRSSFIGKSISIVNAKPSDAGNYRCQTSSGGASDFVRLEIATGLVILQAPPNVYEGDTLALRCHSRQYTAINTTFYKDNAILQHLYRNSILQIVSADSRTTGRYRCEQQLMERLFLIRTYVDEVPIDVQELFTNPKLNMTPQPVLKGDHLTLTCNTSLTPQRKNTDLLFAFYRDGQKVQDFNPSKSFEIRSVLLEDSGNYLCEVRTSTNSVMKMSGVLNMEVKGGNALQNIARLALSAAILVVIAMFVYYRFKFVKSMEARI